jgi:thiol-disulfide isomerase/thioredoxin
MRKAATMVLALAAVACSPHSDLPAGVLSISGRAPAVSGSLIDGGAFGPGGYRGKTLVVNFFNPLCAPCVVEQPVLQRDWTRFRRSDVLFVGIHYVGGQWPRSVSAVRQYLRRMGVTYPVLEDPDSRLSRAFAIQGIPSSVIVDRRGKLRFRILGRVRAGELSGLLRRLD